jgi:hypothetical protein
LVGLGENIFVPVILVSRKICGVFGEKCLRNVGKGKIWHIRFQGNACICIYVIVMLCTESNTLWHKQRRLMVTINLKKKRIIFN